MTPILEVKNLNYIYSAGTPFEHKALDNVSFAVNRGEFIGIIGHTGSGKSTLMQMLNGLYLPTEGNVYFEGRDITEKDFLMKHLRQKVGLVFQNPENQLFAETVERDVCFGPENMDISKVEAQKRAYEAIRLVGLPDTIYDLSPLQLSGGQKRRVAIAGVLAMQPDYLVLDEPTAGLDPDAARELLDLLKQLQEETGITVVMVSHNLEEVAEYADRVVVLKEGRKILDGKTNAVLQQVGALEQAGLLVPIGIKMIYQLQKTGMPMNIQSLLSPFILHRNQTDKPLSLVQVVVMLVLQRLMKVMTWQPGSIPKVLLMLFCIIVCHTVITRFL